MFKIRTSVKNGILKDFDNKCALYSDFTVKVFELIKEILKENNLPTHSISYRIKDRNSFEKKLLKAQRKYSKVEDITDISGIRIITYFSDDVDKVATIIEKEFDIDRKNSVDKRTLLDPDRFGYLSLHYVVKISPERLKFTEYKRFGTCTVEIQIRSILQHAWAEIEHDLGYKGKLAVPRDIRRRFSRLAGLLETADTEFIGIRDSLVDYEVNVRKEIVSSPSEVLIDQASLISYAKNSPIVAELDEAIAKISGSTIVNDYSSLARDIPKLKFAGINTIGKLDKLLEENRESIIKFAEPWLAGEKFDETMPGISIFYLLYLLIGRSKSKDYVTEYLQKNNIGSEDETPEEIADSLLKVLSRIK